MDINAFLERIKTTPGSVTFEDTLAVIEQHYEFTPTAFKNGDLQNEAGQNSGSCKIFSFAKLHSLTPGQTLHCFGNYYRNDVLANPENTNHQNIRNFMKTGWEGISFEGEALRAILQE